MVSGSLLSVEQWEQIEREEHDLEYADSAPYRIDVEQAIAYEDYCYKPGCRVDRGHRTRKAFDAIGLHDLNGKTILDIGCGNGKYSVLFALLGATVYGFDISPVGVTQAQLLGETNGVGERCHFSVQNAQQMSYADRQFDIVVLHEVLHHAIKYPGVREEVYRVLKPGGKLVITESLYGNPLLDLGRKFSMRGKEAKGDVILTLDDIQNFTEGFSERQIEMMSLLFMAKRVFQSRMRHGSVRKLMLCLKRTDDVLLGMMPFLRRYCGECLVVAYK